MRWGKHIAAAGVLAISTQFAMAETAPSDVKFEDFAVKESLTGQPGNPEEGAGLFSNRKAGNCLACHANSDKSKELFHGDVGPSLDGVGSRYDLAQLRAIVVDAKMIFTEDTVMPGFYSLKVGENVAEKHQGKTILSAQQIEDIVAYLATLKE